MNNNNDDNPHDYMTVNELRKIMTEEQVKQCIALRNFHYTIHQWLSTAHPFWRKREETELAYGYNRGDYMMRDECGGHAVHGYFRYWESIFVKPKPKNPIIDSEQ